MKELLKKYWGYGKFRESQKEIIENLVNKKDTFVVMPTGGGKSLCYQMSALLLKGSTLVVSPLIALMKNQVDKLQEQNINAIRVDSTLSSSEYFSSLDKIREGLVKLIYVSPEKLLSSDFLDIISEIEISLIAIDEVHCVSSWGHDFRTDYRNLYRIREEFPHIPIGAFTATATPEVIEDVKEILNLQKPKIFKNSFYRENLTYRIKDKTSKTLMPQIQEILAKHKNSSGIIYCRTKDATEQIARDLSKKGYKVEAYHAGMNNIKRSQIQENFQNDKIQIIVATIAFGMGIDKSNIRFVIHSDMPKSIENYQQETGRAGRDGHPAECVMFYNGSDYHKLKYMVKSTSNEELELKKINDIYNFASSFECRNKALLKYFGEYTRPEWKCNNCDICLEEHKSNENSIEIAQKIVSSVYRLNGKLGVVKNAEILIGASTDNIIDRGYNELSTYGILKDYEKNQVIDWIKQLINQNYITSSGEYPVLSPTTRGINLLKGKEQISLFNTSKKIKKKKINFTNKLDENLYQQLKQLRNFLAKEQNLPADLIFKDDTLKEMAKIKPLTPQDFLLVHGVGEIKCQKYSKEFTEVIKNYLQA